MKKIFVIVLSIVMCFGLVACSGGGEQEASGPKELKLVDCGYSYIDGYLYYAVVIKNPNEDIMMEFPSLRITARDEEGNVIATEDQTFGEIHAGQTFEYASLGLELSEAPTNVDFEILPFDDYGIIEEDSSEYANIKKLTVNNVTASVDSIGWPTYSGEIVNDNEYDISSVAVSVLYRDSDNKLIGGDTTYVDNVVANGKTPFTLDVMTDQFKYESYEIFVNLW